MDNKVYGYYYNGKFYSDSAHQNEITGQTGKIYIDIDSGDRYRWNGTEYVPISLVFREVLHDPGLAEGDYQSLFPHYINKMKYDIELVWSSNTRRNSSAKMTGKIIAHKYKLDVSWKADLPEHKLAILRELALSSQEWHKLMFTNEVGNNITRTFYVGTYNVEPYCFWEGDMLYTSINMTFIER